MTNTAPLKRSESQTFDVFLSHNSKDKPAVERLARKLQQQGLAPWLDQWQLTPGGNWQDELAAGLSACAACAVFIGPHGLGDWVRMELDVATDRVAKDRTFRLFLVLLPGLPEPFDTTALPPFLRMRTWVDLRAGLEDAAAFTQLVCAIKGVPVPTADVAPEPGICPYRGLETFDEAHAEFYFGREGDMQRLVERLKDTRFMAVVGASGTGKSSLVRAGLIPALKKGVLPGSDSWTFRTFTPGAQPLTALATQVLLLHERESMHRTLDELAADQRTLHLATTLALADRPPGDRVVWVIDQFEEVFTQCRDESERAQFLANLLYAASIPDGRCVVLLTLRADYYPRCAAYPEYATQFATQQYLVGPLDTDGLRRTIEEPAWLLGLEFEAGLIDTILDDVTSQPGALPLLEHALLELWERRRGTMLTLEGYRMSGGVQGAIAKRAEAIFNAFTPQEQAIARNLLLRLTQPGEGTESTRRQAAMDELITSAASSDTVEYVVTTLVDARLLTMGVAQPVPQRWVNVAHEALVRGWPRLQEWINADREGLRLHHQLAHAAQEWEERHDDGMLYRGVRLVAALEWRATHEGDLNEAERRFLDASLDLQRREERGRRRRVRQIVGGLSAALLIISSIAVYAFIEQHQAVLARQDADRQRLRAVRQQQIATSGELAANAMTALPSDPALSILLAAAAAHVAPTTQAENALRRALLESHVRTVYRGQAGDVSGVQFSPDGRLVLSTAEGGPAHLWDPRTGRAGPSLGQAVERATFNSDGTLVVTAGDADHTAQVWNARTGKPAGPSVQQADVLTTATLSANGAWLLTASDDGTAAVWDAHTGRQLAHLQPLPGLALGAVMASFSAGGSSVLTLGPDSVARLWDWRHGASPTVLHVKGATSAAAFSPDGALVATGGTDGTARIWQARTGHLLYVLPGHTGAITGVAFSPDGARLVTTSDDRTARLWQVAGGKALAVLSGHTAAVTSATFSRDSTLLATASADDTARLWDGRTGAPLGVLAGHTGALTGVAFSPDGTLVATSGYDGTARVWDVSTQRVLSRVLWRKQGTFSSAALSANSRLVATGSQDGTVQLWDARTGRAGPLLPGHSQQVNSVAFNDQGTEVLSASVDGSSRIWDARSGKLVRVLEEPGSGTEVQSAVFSPDGGLVATTETAGANGTARLWSARSGALLHTLRGPVDGYRPAVFSPDGKTLVTLSGDNQAGLWDTSSGSLLVTLPRTAGSAVFSPNSALLARITTEGYARVCDARTGMNGHDVDYDPNDPVTALAFSPDGSLLLVGSQNGNVRLWNVGNWTEAADWHADNSQLTGVAFSAGGQFVITTGRDGHAGVWDLATQDNLASWSAAGGGAVQTVQTVLGAGDTLLLAHTIGHGIAIESCALCGSLNGLIDLVPERVTRTLSAAERARYLRQPGGST